MGVLLLAPFPQKPVHPRQLTIQNWPITFGYNQGHLCPDT